jgi:hypothetical protein
MKGTISSLLCSTVSSRHSYITQGSTLTVVRLPGASEMIFRASENGTQLVRSGK